MAKSLIDEFLEGVGNAVRDVREKVVEEAWFGRTVTDNIPPSPELNGQESPAMSLGSAKHVKEIGHQPERDDPAREPDFDR
jgi:hypothetical protein